ncbi:acetylornithine deacetylase [Mangrovibrevibacter kandeliae]|uniref:acetylornithine deacetylase n=1 Tax=Mangrovibrevibacter kandeliae TaxID=2968473 RepID=UPI002119B3F5|nr:acetylornithine deacetylase [Aurantimonas sp. CSK15Z-1]MCQ8781867.1 acetylornithine deacetylase [Aurantimonas sp. CSK15Z-1]
MSAETACEAMLARLVGFPTVSSASNLPLIDFAAEHLSAHGIASHRVPNADGSKTNLWATIGPDVAGGVVLSGHTDVVPTEGQVWDTDPFTLTKRGDRLYGRGTTDMKSFVAIALALAPEMAAAGLKRPIHLALSYDEEVGCLGAPAMIADMRNVIAPPRAVIVGEPTKMQVVTGHKGVMGLEVHVRGKPVHSSVVHEGVSAVMVAARLIGWLGDRMERNRLAAATAGESLYDPPYTTLHCGRIEGGTAHNITAKDCRFTVDVRTMPGERSADYLAEFAAFAARLEADMHRVDGGTGIDIVRRSDTPSCRREPAGEAEALARSLTGDNAEHVVAYGTEAGQFQDASFSTVVCGPGDMEQGHKPNEFITLEQLAAGAAFQRRLIAQLAA